MSSLLGSFQSGKSDDEASVRNESCICIYIGCIDLSLFIIFLKSMILKWLLVIVFDMYCFLCLTSGFGAILLQPTNRKIITVWFSKGRCRWYLKVAYMATKPQ